MQLMHFAEEYRRDLLQYKLNNNLSESGQESLHDVSRIIENIINQQPEELREVE